MTSMERTRKRTDRRSMNGRTVPEAGRGELAGETPTMRLFSLLELIATKDEFVSLQSLAEETGTPKPTLHRMLQQLEAAELLVRQSDGRHYGTGNRLRHFAEDLLLNATQHGARHAVLAELVDELGEACNLTTLSGSDVVYLDRAETPEPLRFYLSAGSRVPVHCSASGKMLLSQLSEQQRRKLLGHTTLKRLTSKTVVDLAELEANLDRVREDGFAIDDEEFLPGLVCAAVLVPNPAGRSNLCLAVQAPAMRVSAEDAPGMLPALRRAARTISAIEAEGAAS